MGQDDKAVKSLADGSTEENAGSSHDVSVHTVHYFYIVWGGMQ